MFWTVTKHTLMNMGGVISWNSKRLLRGSWVTGEHFMSLSFSFMFPERPLLSSQLGISFLQQDLGLCRYGGATGAARAGASCRWPGTLSPLPSAPSGLSWLTSHSRNNPRPNINSEVVKPRDSDGLVVWTLCALLSEKCHLTSPWVEKVEWLP